jgi:hypothetical protein
MKTIPPLGAFPEAGPVTYLRLGVGEVRSALGGAYPKLAIWYHATIEEYVPSICTFGLVPSCWWGSDGCCVFGADKWSDAVARGTGWVIEIESACLPGQLRAWWVPADAIRGGWNEDRFYPREELAPLVEAAPPVRNGCWCDLTELVSEQIGLWRKNISRSWR